MNKGYISEISRGKKEKDFLKNFSAHPLKEGLHFKWNGPNWGFGGHLPFTSEAAGSSLSENFLNATRTQSSCEKSKSQRSAESRGFPPGTPVSSHRES